MEMDNYQLTEAICRQDIKKVKRILASGKYSVNGDEMWRDPPLIECVASQRRCDIKEDARRCEILKLLVDVGADLNVQSFLTWPYAATAVIIAAGRGYLKCLQFLVKSGADLTITCEGGSTALILAVMVGNLACVMYLLQVMPIPILNHRRHDGMTALMMAASRYSENNANCLQQLIEKPIDLDVKNGDGSTALILALQVNFFMAVELLLHKGASVKIVTHSGDSLLTLLPDSEHNYIPEFMHHGFDLTMSRRNRFSLHKALIRINSKRVRDLVMNGFPPLNFRVKKFAALRSTPVSPLAVAILNKLFQVAKYLIINRFFTHYDAVRLCWEPEIRKTLQHTSEIQSNRQYVQYTSDARSIAARNRLEILDFLSTRPLPLRDLCMIIISSILSHDFASMPPVTRNSEDRWVCRPTFRERVQLLEIPPVFKRELLHRTPYAGLPCQHWFDITLR
ncbi:kinase D-interacting substrate of 220 kDa [Elysia marginata]|uniref:Kinase D-interacting substrate of 220 kDa n=1 Tax=Elysia marginata TaxID=1093978 RepID=A0AAV4IFJ3_9GAST|nr:kinase D-interacting substrate of 220 kDa [Elysia marginata]